MDAAAAHAILDTDHLVGIAAAHGHEGKRSRAAVPFRLVGVHGKNSDCKVTRLLPLGRISGWAQWRERLGRRMRQAAKKDDNPKQTGRKGNDP